MEPEENPYAALLSIDYAAIKAREYSYLIDLRDSKEWIDETGWLLNIHYTAALAEYMSEKDQKKDHTKSSESLSETIKRFPWLVAQLYYALKLKFPQEFPTTIPSSPLQALYTDLYIHRAKDLWAVPEISIWLQSVVTDVALQVVQPPPSQTLSHIPMNVARHLLVMNVPALMGHIPREYSSRTQLAIDPLPPENSISPYDAPMREMQETVRDETALGRLVARLMRRQPPDMDGIELDDADFEGPDENDDDYYTDEELTDEFSDEDNEGLVSQLTNTIRNAFRWLGGREEQPEERDAGDEEPLD